MMMKTTAAATTTTMETKCPVLVPLRLLLLTLRFVVMTTAFLLDRTTLALLNCDSTELVLRLLLQLLSLLSVM